VLGVGEGMDDVDEPEAPLEVGVPGAAEARAAAPLDFARTRPKERERLGLGSAPVAQLVSFFLNMERFDPRAEAPPASDGASSCCCSEVPPSTLVLGAEPMAPSISGGFCAWPTTSSASAAASA